MRIDELHKFSDGTLNDVQTALDDRLKGIRMQYLPQTIWRRSDKDRAATMIQAIDKQLTTRRIMRSLEKFVDYGHIKWIEDLVPRTMWSQVPVSYDKHALWGISHWGRKRQQFYGFAINRESARDVYSKRVKSYQKKLNLTKPDTYRLDLKRKEAYTAYSNPRGFIYKNKDKQNRLMRIDELHKFSDGTLNDVQTALDDRLKGIRMQYLPQTIWRRSDKDRAATMIQAIDKQLTTRRIMRSLEKFVGGRLYEGDFRLLQRTI
nr:hypothetical protein [Tanacetum cinerariifolium]